MLELPRSKSKATYFMIVASLSIMQFSQNVSIFWEMNFYDKNTCWGKEI
jgi:hypothetical protein